MKIAAFFPCLFAVCAVLAVASPVRAQDPVAPPSGSGLSDNAIRLFYQQEVDSYKWAFSRFNTFLASSMTDNFIADNAVTVTMPDKPPESQPNTQSKASIAGNARGEYDMMKNATVAMTVTAIRRAPDGQSASVDYTTAAHDITVGAPGGQQMSADSESKCTDTLVLATSGAPQIKNTRCTTAVNVVTGITRGFGRAGRR